MTEREKNLRRQLALRAKFEPKVARLISRALAECSAQARALIRSEQFDAVRYAEYPRDAMKKAYQRTYSSVGVAFGKIAMQSIVKATFNSDWWTRYFISYVENYMGHKIDALLDFYEETIMDLIGKALIEGQATGMSYKEIADKLLEDIEGIDGKTAMRVARTEVVAASNFSQLEVIKKQGFEGVTMKIWSTIIDNRTHQTHIEANGQAVPINEKFVVGGYTCDYPCSEELPTQERDWCRCGMVYELDPAIEAELSQYD